jgi:hypothetical protein
MVKCRRLHSTGYTIMVTILGIRKEVLLSNLGPKTDNYDCFVGFHRCVQTSYWTLN